jgi:hypothetical protein
MSTIDSAPVSEAPPLRRRRESWPAKAKRHGVSTRTLDRWVEQRIIEPPEYIRGRKYGDADEEPRRDIDAA